MWGNDSVPQLPADGTPTPQPRYFPPLHGFRFGYVIDFLDLYIGQAHWPFFNAADSCISVGACLMLDVLFRRKPECSPSS